MSKPETLSSITLPAPTGGLDFYNPLAAMSQSNSPWMVNVDAENRSVRVRNAYRRFATVNYTPGGVDQYHLSAMETFGQGDDEVIYALVLGTADTRIYKITAAGVVTLDATIAGAASAPYNFKFAGNLVFICGGGGSFFLDLSVGTWAAWTLVLGGSGAPDPGAALFYKGRIYLTDGGGLTTTIQTIGYGDVGQIQGTSTNAGFAVGKLFNTNTRVPWMGTFVLSNESQSVEYVAFGNQTGEVLVYSGDNPGADNWTLVARLQIPRPIMTGTKNLEGSPVFAYENDTLIFTYGGVISLKTLFINRDKAAIEGAGFISLQINTYWSQLVAGIPSVTPASGKSGQGISAAFHEKDRAIYILVQGHIDVSGTLNTSASTMFVYDLNSLSWSIHKITAQIGARGSAYGPAHVRYFQGGIYFWTDQYNHEARHHELA